MIRLIGAWIALAISPAGCASQTPAPATETPRGAPLAAWQQQMDQARRLVAAGNIYIIYRR